MSAANSPAISSCPISPPPGDGLIAALQVLAVIAGDGKPASEAAHLFEPAPQILENVRFKNGSPLADEKVKSVIKAVGSAPQRHGPASGAQIRHRARDPRHGRGRRREAAARSGQRSRRGDPRSGA